MDPSPPVERRGRLTVVGTGIDAPAQTTPQAREAIAQADEVLYLTADLFAARFVEQLNPRARSLQGRYGETKPRRDTYAEMVEDILAPIRAGADTCVVFYGHPGVLVTSTHRAIAIARAEGYPARMLPAVSALDCLVADLGIDPATPGLVSYDATAFLLQARVPEVTATLVLWQPDILGQRFGAPDGRGSRLPVLVEYLCRFYPAEHGTIVYSASPIAVADPGVAQIPLGDLRQDLLPRASTLVVPALAEPVFDHEMFERLQLGLDPATEKARL